MDVDYWRPIFLGTLAHFGILGVLTLFMAYESLFFIAVALAFVSGAAASFMVAKRDATSLGSGLVIGLLMVAVGAAMTFLLGFVIAFTLPSLLRYVVIIFLGGISVPGLLIGGTLGGRLG